MLVIPDSIFVIVSKSLIIDSSLSIPFEALFKNLFSSFLSFATPSMIDKI